MDEAGRSRGAMGVAWADTKNGKGAALAIGNFSNELKSLYWTDTGEVFLDESPRSGVGPTSLLDLTFGVLFFDADLDGRHGPPPRQRPRRADGAGRSRRTSPTGRRRSSTATPATAASRRSARARATSRRRSSPAAPPTRTSTATATSTSSSSRTAGPARVFLNPTDAPDEERAASASSGAGKSNRDAVGARVTATIGGRTLTQQVSGGQSYLSASEKTLTFGLGARREDRHARDPLARRRDADARRTSRAAPG